MSQTETGNMATRYSVDTDSVAEKERFDFYREVVGQNILRFTPERPRTGNVFASVNALNLDSNVSISRVTLSPQVVHRSSADLLRSSHDYYHLGMNYGGRLYKANGPDTLLRNPNKLYFSDSSIESKYVIDEGQNSSLLCVLLPKSLVRAASAVNINDGVDFELGKESHVLRGAIKMLDQRMSSGSLCELNALASAVTTLLAAELIRDSEKANFLTSGCSTGLGGWFLIAREAIDAHLAYQELSPEIIANQLGISVRYLQKVLQSNGTTFHQYVVSGRLRKIRQELLDETLRDRTAGEIAARWGMTDTTTFHRNYKATFDETPHQSRLLLQRNSLKIR